MDVVRRPAARPVTAWATAIAVAAGVFGWLASGGRGEVAAAPLGVAAISSDVPPASPSPTTTITVAPAPCSPRPGDGACTLDPRTLTVTFPSGTASLSGVVVAWTTTGRPVATPGPAQPTVALAVADGGCKPVSESLPATTCSWPWPRGLEAAGSTVVLNGTYLVTACANPALVSGSASPGPPGGSPAAATVRCQAAPDLGPAGIGLAVPPAPVGQVRATATSAATGSPVTVTWTGGPEPDLAGYVVTRNGAMVFTCTLHGATIGSASPCGPKLAYTDRPPGGGLVTYSVAASRFALDGTTAHDVVSAPGTATLRLGGAPAVGSVGVLPPLPVIGPPRTLPPLFPPVGSGTPDAPQSPPTTADPGFGNLPYRGSSEVASPVLANGAGSKQADVRGLGLIAAGLLVLAVAAHLLYLRAAAARHQRFGPSPRTASGR